MDDKEGSVSQAPRSPLRHPSPPGYDIEDEPDTVKKNHFREDEGEACVLTPVYEDEAPITPHMNPPEATGNNPEEHSAPEPQGVGSTGSTSASASVASDDWGPVQDLQLALKVGLYGKVWQRP